MITAMVWLLISMPAVSNYGNFSQAAVVERFTNKEDCERVAEWIKANNKTGIAHGCIAARISQ